MALLYSEASHRSWEGLFITIFGESTSTHPREIQGPPLSEPPPPIPQVPLEVASKSMVTIQLFEIDNNSILRGS